jgi:hypothetical protein
MRIYRCWGLCSHPEASPDPGAPDEQGDAHGDQYKCDDNRIELEHKEDQSDQRSPQQEEREDTNSDQESTK